MNHTYLGRYSHVLLERTTCFTYAGDDDRHSHQRRVESVLCRTQIGEPDRLRPPVVPIKTDR